MDSRQNEQLRHGDIQHNRFSWQTPPETPPEQDNQNYQQPQPQPQQNIQQPTQPHRIHTDIDGQSHNRAFSYAQTPSEHLAFQYIPSPSDAPPVPRMPTPIDARPASIYTAHQQAIQPQTQHYNAAPAHSETRPMSPPMPTNRASVAHYPQVPPVSEPPQAHTQQPANRPSQHARNLSNLQPIITSLDQHAMQTILQSQPVNDLPQKLPMTPISPNSIRKEPISTTSPTSKASYAHEPYSPHSQSNPNNSINTRHAVFSPDSAHGPNGLDFSLHRPGQIAHPNMDLSATGTKQPWKSSLCACTPDISTCLTGLFCPCILYGRTSYRLSQKSAKQDPTDLLSHDSTNGHCILMGLSCGLWWLFPMLHRTRIRHLYKLKGDLGGDCVKGMCCCCCVAVQNEREVKLREEGLRRWAGPASADVYGREGGMKYMPQH